MNSSPVFYRSALNAAPLDEVEMNALAIPINFVGTIHLDAEGRAEKVDGIADSDQGTQRIVRRLLAKWRFSPTIKSGSATEGVLDFQLAVGQILPDWNRLQTDALRKRRGSLTHFRHSAFWPLSA